MQEPNELAYSMKNRESHISSEAGCAEELMMRSRQMSLKKLAKRPKGHEAGYYLDTVSDEPRPSRPRRSKVNLSRSLCLAHRFDKMIKNDETIKQNERVNQSTARQRVYFSSKRSLEATTTASQGRARAPAPACVFCFGTHLFIWHFAGFVVRLKPALANAPKFSLVLIHW